MATNYMTYDDAADVLQAYANKIKEGGGSVKTWAQYQALPSEQQNSGLYYITDKNGCDITANDLAITDANNILGGGAGAATDTQTLMNGATNKINQLNQSLTDAPFKAIALGDNDDLDTKYRGVYNTTAYTSNTPGAFPFLVISYGSNFNYVQIACRVSDGVTYLRSCYAGTWKAWKQMTLT